jgi:N-acetylmuramic acid 6-phosphate etherase
LPESRHIFNQLQKLITEQRNPYSMDIDTRPIEEILRIINNEDQIVAQAVATQIPYITKAVELVVDAFQNGGHLFYIGAGTSGRLGVLDAVECPPTFGTDYKMVQGIIAGGEKAMFRAQEGAEDKEENGSRDILKRKINRNDVVCGIAASLRTPYVVGAIKEARRQGTHTIYITTNPRSNFDMDEFKVLGKAIDIAICPEVGPEVIMGSTRMKSGTAQKFVLNMITTTAMIRLGKIFENMMIDLKITNLKLRERAHRIIMTVTNVSYEEAVECLKNADYQVKSALVMIKTGVTLKEAKVRLEEAKGFVRLAIEGKDNRI